MTRCHLMFDIPFSVNIYSSLISPCKVKSQSRGLSIILLKLIRNSIIQTHLNLLTFLKSSLNQFYLTGHNITTAIILCFYLHNPGGFKDISDKFSDNQFVGVSNPKNDLSNKYTDIYFHRNHFEKFKTAVLLIQNMKY